MKLEKKKRKNTKDPMSIFDFYDDDENASGTVELRSSITTNENEEKIQRRKKIDQQKKTNKSNRRSTLIISNNVPSDARCKECSNRGTNQTMTA